MKREIRQDGKTVLYSEDDYSIPLIFNILAGKSFKGGEYSDYSFRSHSLHEIHIQKNRIRLNRNGGKQAITVPPLMCFIAGGRDRQRSVPASFLTIRTDGPT